MSYDHRGKKRSRCMNEERGGMTLEEVGKVLGITRERVRQIEVAALKKLRRPAIRAGLMPDHLKPTLEREVDPDVPEGW